jgi:hypothetical protein
MEDRPAALKLSPIFNFQFELFSFRLMGSWLSTFRGQLFFLSHGSGTSLATMKLKNNQQKYLNAELNSNSAEKFEQYWKQFV